MIGLMFNIEVEGTVSTSVGAMVYRRCRGICRVPRCLLCFEGHELIEGYRNIEEYQQSETNILSKA